MLRIVLCLIVLASPLSAQSISSDPLLNVAPPFRPFDQVVAQAACVGMSDTSGLVLAVPRMCDNTTASCEQICATMGQRTTDQQVVDLANKYCIGAIHVYDNQPASKYHHSGLKVYNYQSCGESFCGPNYCCCGAK